MMYYRPLVVTDPALAADALPLAGGPHGFAMVEVLSRGAPPTLMPASAVPEPWLTALTAPRAPIAGVDWSEPRLMAVLNATPDSFSDGGLAEGPAALTRAEALIGAGADILDVGGESTRPGARPVDPGTEFQRVNAVITAMAEAHPDCPISVDTRKGEVAEAAIAAGARIWNDVSALTYEPENLDRATRLGVPICLMHAQGHPETMQDNPRYDNVLLDVYDALAARIAAVEAAGIPRARLMVDPGIGFGKTLRHNVTLIQGLALFHGLGCPILLGVSRKGFIGAIGLEPDKRARAPGSIAVGLAALGQGVQILRVHDMAETKQAVRLWRALHPGAAGRQR
ncbi:MAG: dihydropteroate synthase [Pseudomonadota bacterium]